MTPQQPYFPPPSHNLPKMPTIWRTKKQLVMAKQAVLPYRCVKCNARADTLLKRKLRWHHPAIYLLIIVGFLFYAILALVLSKNATINVGLCAAHASARKRDIAISCGAVLLSIVSFYAAATTDEVTFAMVGTVLFLGGVIYGVARSRIVAPRKIDDQFVWLNGVNASYLEELPEWRGAV
jgi:hypothetical protein